jgi:hypothetical protein
VMLGAIPLHTGRLLSKPLDSELTAQHMHHVP